MNITVYKTSTGEILRTVVTNKGEEILQCGQGEAFINGAYSDIEFKVENGIAIPLVKPQKSIGDIKDEVRASLNVSRDLDRYSDIYVVIGGDAHMWQANNTSQSLISNTIMLAESGVAQCPPIWRDADNNDVSITIDDLKAIAAAIAARTQDAYAKSWQLKAQLDAATTEAEVAAVVW